MKMKTRKTAIVALILIASIAISVHRAFGQTATTASQSDMWHLWVFIFNIPPDAHNIKVALVDDSNNHNEIYNATVGPNTNATGDPEVPTATWQGFDVPTSAIGAGTGYYVCLSGQDIKNQCSTVFTHDGNNKDTSVPFNWGLLDKANSGDNNQTSDHNNNQQNQTAGTTQPAPGYTTRVNYVTPTGPGDNGYRGSWGFHCYKDDYGRWHCPDAGFP